MSLEEELSAQSSDKETVITIGVFDGVHLGHKELLAEVKHQAEKLSCLSGVVTFRQHPDELVYSGKILPHLTSLDERIARLKAEGMDKVIVISFNRDMMEIPARDFVILLKKYLKIKALVIGPDFALGKKRQGDMKYLTELGKEFGFTVTQLKPKVINGEIISSTAIRRALAEGDMKHVFRLAGQYFSLAGPVVAGFGRGKGLGFPTANLDVEPKQALPPDGVYATHAYIDGILFQSMTSIGVRPTFGKGNRSIEVFILDYKGDLYGKNLKVEFIERLRPEKKFSSPEELKKQIEEDVDRGREILGQLDTPDS
jgi:riboflavin kinase / FMN adenylyltransferase